LCNATKSSGKIKQIKGVFILIFKVLYQPDKTRNPQRELTQSLYLEANSAVEARALVEENTNYNIELIQELTGNFLEFEQKEPSFKLTEFN
jgi:DNA-dependent RNA polymerase auxiliary subunit epsilon